VGRVSFGGVKRLAQRSRYFESPVRYALMETFGTGRAGAHRIVGTGLDVHLRQGSPDVNIVDEVFAQGLYEPPAPVAKRLAALGPRLRILDVGGHVGVFGVWALTRFPDALVLSIEPDPGSGRLLARSAAALPEQWHVLHAAAAAETGWRQFAALGRPDSHLIDPDAAGGVPTFGLDLLPMLAASDFAKIDIEGSEWMILRDQRLGRNRPEVLVLEYHAGGGEGDPGATATSLLQAVGYEVLPIPDAPVGAGMLWGWLSGGDERNAPSPPADRAQRLRECPGTPRGRPIR
jgi:FkbM family methyltransferase